MRKLLAFLFVLVPFMVSAQSLRTVRGTVVDADGEALQGAVLSYFGSATEVKTNPDGSFAIDIPFNITALTASCVGYFSQTQELDGSYMVFKLKFDKKYHSKQAKIQEARSNSIEHSVSGNVSAVNTTADQTRVSAAAEKAQARDAAKQAKDAAKQAKAAAANEQAQAKAAAAKARQEEKEAAEAAKAQEQARLAEERAAAAKKKQEEYERMVAEAKAKLEAEKYMREKAKEEERKKKAAIKQTKAAERAKRIETYNQKYHNKGFVHTLDLNYSFVKNTGKVVYENLGVMDFDSSGPIGLTYTLGYRFSNWIALGVGTGVNYEISDLRRVGDRFAPYYYDNSIEAISNYTNIIVPLFLKADAFLCRGKFQPMVSFAGGTYLTVPKVYGQMWLIDAGAGLNIRMSKRGSFFAQLSYGTAPVLAGNAAPKENIFEAYRCTQWVPRIKVGFTF